MNYSTYTCTILTVLSKYSQYNLPARAIKSLASELGSDSETLHVLRWPLMSLEHSILVPRVLSLPPSRKYPGFGWSRVSLKQTAPHHGGLAFLQEAKGKANANLFKLARRQRNGSH